ncbi:YoaK family protein [Archangium violaceum]|uniref:YoaK family protein n=1 Tax=Archangium violaceum TaxID=83451 RepID=UPI001362C187|nr:YoaK family protein [Archangium violaceum]
MPHKNRQLAGYLALVAGFVNSASFILLGSFTSHVTGSAGRLANDVVARDFPAAISAILLVVTFYLGAFTASCMLHTGIFPRAPLAYAAALFSEAALLFGFVALSENLLPVSPRRADAYAGLLCFAMGMQNSLVTYITGARIRTTHITGVVTDLGIETARWWRWHREQLARATGLPLVVGTRRRMERPDGSTLIILLTIVGAFLVGAVSGAEMVTLIGARAMLLPGVAVLVASVFALLTGRKRTASQ